MSNKVSVVEGPEELEKLLKDLQEDTTYTHKGGDSFISHLKSSLYDWRVERNWEKKNTTVYTIENKGFIFSYTTQVNPSHCTIRHLFVNEACRGEQIGSKLYDHLIKELSNAGVKNLRMFVSPSAVGFYRKKGIVNYHGYSKTKMPFYYGDLYGTLHPLPKSQRKYVVDEKKSVNGVVIDLS